MTSWFCSVAAVEGGQPVVLAFPVALLALIAALGLPVILAGFGGVENSKGPAIAAAALSALMGAFLLFGGRAILGNLGEGGTSTRWLVPIWAIGAVGSAAALARVTLGRSRRFWGEAPEPDELGPIRLRPLAEDDGPGGGRFEAGDP